MQTEVWLPFPAPPNLKFIDAPSGSACYELRHKSSKQPVLFGQSAHCQWRMRSLMIKPWGSGTRKNMAKRLYVTEHYADIEYRTLPCLTPEEAKQREKEFVRSRYLFGT